MAVIAVSFKGFPYTEGFSNRKYSVHRGRGQIGTLENLPAFEQTVSATTEKMTEFETVATDFSAERPFRAV